MAGWHHRLDGNEFEHTPGDSEGQEAWHATWDLKETEMTQQLNNNGNKPNAVLCP